MNTKPKLLRDIYIPNYIPTLTALKYRTGQKNTLSVRKLLENGYAEACITGKLQAQGNLRFFATGFHEIDTGEELYFCAVPHQHPISSEQSLYFKGFYKAGEGLLSFLPSQSDSMVTKFLGFVKGLFSKAA